MTYVKVNKPKKSKRSRRYRRYGNRQTLWNSKMYSAYDLASAAYNGLWRLKGLVNSEMHKLDVSVSTSVTDAGSVTHLSGVAQNDTVAGRTGNSIYVRALNLKCTAAKNGSATQSFFRVAIVQDTQQISDTVPAYSDIYEAADVNAHLNTNTVGRFKILYDKKLCFDASNSVQEWEINLPMRHHVRYNGTANTDEQKGALYLAMVSNETTNGVQFAARSRLSFHDN